MARIAVKPWVTNNKIAGQALNDKSARNDGQ